MPEKQTEAEFQADVLVLEFENAMERCRDPASITCLKTLIQTVHQVPADIFDIYVELFEELPDTELHQEMLTEVREGSWLPETATEFVERFISRTTGTSR
jgi:hypothetical protein